MVILITLAAACLLGLGFVAQQHAAYREPLGEMLHIELLLHLVRIPLWLAGIGAMFCGQVLGAVALNGSDVAKVEPLLATNLIFALFAAHLIYQEHLSWREWLGAVLATGGIALFLAVGRPQGGDPTGPGSARWLTAAFVVAAAAALVIAGRRTTLRTKAMLLASAAGMLYGLQDALTRGVLLTFDLGPRDVFTSFEPYVLVGTAVVGLLLAQSAFDAAPLRVSLPATTAAEPITGIVLGVVIFGEHLRITPGALAGEVAGLIAMVGGIMLLAGSPSLGKADGEPAPGPSAKIR